MESIVSFCGGMARKESKIIIQFQVKDLIQVSICNFFTERSDDEKPTTGNLNYEINEARDKAEKLKDDPDEDEIHKDPGSAPRSEIDDDPEYRGKEETTGNDDQFVGQDSSRSEGSETEVVIKSNDESDSKELEDKITKQPTVDNLAEATKSPEVSKSLDVDDGDTTNNKLVVDDNTPMPDIRPFIQPDGELNPYEGLCDGTRCQRPYTWYTTLITHSNMVETAPPPKIDLNNVAQDLKETIDLTRRGRDLKKRRTRHNVRRHHKNRPNTAKQKRRNSQKPSSRLRKPRNQKNMKRKRITKSNKTQKSRKKKKNA